MIATARIAMPRSVVRLSAGRLNFSFADQVGGNLRTKGVGNDIWTSCDASTSSTFPAKFYSSHSGDCPSITVIQALCFMAGANSIFDGDKLLTTPNNERSEDLAMFDALGLTSRPAFHPAGYPAGAAWLST